MMTQQITTTIELITPEKASEYLSLNTMNRPLNRQRLHHYTHLMREGKWGFDPSNSITFAEDGTLLNGQHRLHAVISAGVSVEFMVLRGANKANLIFIDTGKSRDGRDALSIIGCPNARAISSIISFLLINLRKGIATSEGSTRALIEGYITNDDIVREYNSDPNFYQTIYGIANREYKKYRLYPLSNYGAICAYLVKDRYHDISKVEEFYKALNDGTEYRYLVWLRQKIVQSLASKNTKDRLPLVQKQAMLSKAWNYFIAGEDRGTVPYKAGDRMQFD